jgi:hypothetical protein
MAMEVHGTPEHDMDCFIKECAHLLHDRWLGGHLSLFFCIQFFKHHVNIAFKCALTFVVERKIALVGNVCSRPLINIRFHGLHVGNIKRALDEIASYHERD